MKDERVAIDVDCIQAALVNAWSNRTSSLWRIENPARGQCSVTACVIHELYGGDILKTLTSDGWHFYNFLNGVRCDFTESQFTSPIQYQDLPSSLEEAIKDTTTEQVDLLRQRVVTELDPYR